MRECNIHVFDFENFEDFYIVKRLILNRLEIEQALNLRIQTNFLESEFDVVGFEVKESIGEIYKDLEFLIDECEFINRNIMLIELFYSGYTIKDVAKIKGKTEQSVKQSINRIVKKINHTAHSRRFDKLNEKGERRNNM